MPFDHVVIRSLLGLGLVLGVLQPTPSTLLNHDKGQQVIPKRPGALAMGPKGVLYIADDARDQILAMEPDRRFKVVAGTGVKGFSGDGGPAIDAKINDPNGMTFGPHGTLYFADSGNHRIRAISPTGVNYTIAGGGAGRSPSNPVKGVRATKLSLTWPVDVKYGSNGQLYFADAGASKVWRLLLNGNAHEVVGDTRYFGLHGLGGAAIRGSADGANGLIVDTRGNLYLSGSATKTLLMDTPNGILTLPFGHVNFYPRGNSGFGMLPSGQVVAIDNQSIVKIDKMGLHRIVNFQHRKLADGIRGFQPNGIAVSRNGTIYCDTYQGNGYSNVSALIAIGRRGTITVIWDS